MSLKSIELQIAIPKTFDAGKLTEQKNQQSMLNHQAAAAQTDTLLQKQRSTVMDSSESEKTANEQKSFDEDESGNGENKEKDRNQNDMHASSHPYKGGFVDYTG